MSRKVVGIHACKEVFKIRPREISSVLIKKDWKQNTELKELHDLATIKKCKIKEIHPQELDKISSGHQGICLEVQGRPELNLTDKSDFFLGLDGVEDPQNLGAILRTGWLLGLQGILILRSRAVGLTPTVCKIASGGAEHVAIEEFNQLIQPIENFKEKGFWVYGLSETSSKTLWDTKFPEKVLLIAGGEEKGLKPQTLKACDELISIPQKVTDSSLNVATSVAIAMAEVTRQRCIKS